MITRFTHVGISVHDLDLAIESWCSRFDLELSHRLDTEVEGFRTALLVTPTDPRGFAVELIAPIDPDDDSNQLVRFLARHGEGLFHLAATVPRIADAAERLCAAGTPAVTVQPGPVGEGLLSAVDPEAERVVVAPRTNNGVLVELLQARS